MDAPTTVDAQTTYLFTIFVNNPIPRGGAIRVIIPPEVGVASLTAAIAGQRINAAVTISPVGANPRDIMLNGGYPGIVDSVPIGGLVAFKLSLLQNPSTAAVSSSF